MKLCLLFVCTVGCLVVVTEADSKCPEFKPISASITEPAERWIAVVETLPKGQSNKFCFVFKLNMYNATAAVVTASKDGKSAKFLMTIPEASEIITTIDLHIEDLPEAPAGLKKTFMLAHYLHGHYYCFVQCSTNYDIYDDYVACFTVQNQMSDVDKADVDQFIDKLGFQLNNKNDTGHVDITGC